MGPTRYKLGIAGNLSISNSCLTALENNSFLQGCETKSEWKELYVQTRLRPEFVPSRLGHMLVTWFQLTSSLVVSILAMSQVCMAASPDTEMRESPLIPNSITVHTLSRRRPVHLSNSHKVESQNGCFCALIFLPYFGNCMWYCASVRWEPSSQSWYHSYRWL